MRRATVILAAGIAVGVASAAVHDWEERAPLPLARTEVAAARVGSMRAWKASLRAAGAATQTAP